MNKSFFFEDSLENATGKEGDDSVDIIKDVKNGIQLKVLMNTDVFLNSRKKRVIQMYEFLVG